MDQIQRAVVLQRLYPSDSYSDLLHPVVVDPQQLQSHFLPTPHWQCNSSLSPYYTQPCFVSSSPPNKRKAEFDAEEEEKEVEAGEDDSEISMKTEKGISSNTCSNESSKLVKRPDFIHVRARRGQATDSHSLAERARREKISKKMKCLQDLVPGCDRVTGKAGMLDEIINYVQSLQKQVEFLSMKLATVNTSLDFSIDSVIAKQMPAYLASLSYNAPQQGTSDSTMDLSQKPGPIPEVFLDLSFISQLQQLSGWESDWPTLFN